MNYFSFVGDALKSLEKPVKKKGANDLAYLVASSKPEAAIRDRLAFRLQQKLGTLRTVAFTGFVPTYSGGTARDLYPLPYPGVTMWRAL